MWMLFAYLKTINVSKKDKFGDAVRYAKSGKISPLFLTDGDVPIDNMHRKGNPRFVLERRWQMIDTIHGAKSSCLITVL